MNKAEIFFVFTLLVVVCSTSFLIGMSNNKQYDMEMEIQINSIENVKNYIVCHEPASITTLQVAENGEWFSYHYIPFSVQDGDILFFTENGVLVHLNKTLADILRR